MRRATFLASALTAIWWSLLLPTWVFSAGIEVAGTELNRTLTLVPGIILLLALISLYGKLSRALLALAGVFALAAAIWVLSADFGGAPKVIELQEMASGIVGGNGDFLVGTIPTVFVGIGIATAAVLFWASLSKQTRRLAVDEKAQDSEDPRFIWDEQSK